MENFINSACFAGNRKELKIHAKNGNWTILNLWGGKGYIQFYFLGRTKDQVSRILDKFDEVLPVKIFCLKLQQPDLFSLVWSTRKVPFTELGDFSWLNPMIHCQQECKDDCGSTKPFSAAKVAVLDSLSWHKWKQHWKACFEADLRFNNLQNCIC